MFASNIWIYFFHHNFSKKWNLLWRRKYLYFTSYYRKRLLLQDRMLQELRAIHRSRRQDVRPAPPLGLTILVQNHCSRQILKIWKNWKYSNDYFIVKKKTILSFAIGQRSKIKDRITVISSIFTTLYISIIDVKLMMVHSADPGFGILKGHNCVSSSILGSYSRISSSV